MVAGSALPSASADAVSDKQAQARALSNQIDAMGSRESALAEQYNAAVLKTQATAAKVRDEQARVAVADAAAAKARGALQADAIAAYLHGGSLVSLASRNGGINSDDGGLLAGEYVSTLASTQSENLDAYRSAAITARETAAQLQAAQQKQDEAAKATDAARRATQASAQQLQATLGKVKGDLASLVAEATAAKEAAALQAALARTRAQASVVANRQGIGSVFAARADVPVPVGAGAGAAVAAARSRLGDPYVWGAAGPSAFDCSGLIMWAWGHAGVSLPHFSGAQYASTTHISMSQLQPGDLVFPGNPGDHVAMYIGGGMVIEAPHTGDVVHIVPMYSRFVLASRP